MLVWVYVMLHVQLRSVVPPELALHSVCMLILNYGLACMSNGYGHFFFCVTDSIYSATPPIALHHYVSI